MKFSQRSKTSLYIIENMSDLSLPHPAQRPRRHKQTQGIALVVVLLSAMVLMVSMLAISATMAISSQRTTAGQRNMLQAQYAAEAGLALAKTRSAEAFALFPLISVPTNTTMAALEAAAVDFCGKSLEYRPNRATLTAPVRVCNAGANNGGTLPANRNYSIFVNHISSAAVTRAITASNTDSTATSSNRDVDTIYLNSYASLTTDAAKTAFWRDIFSGNTARSSISLPSPATGITASYTPTYGFVPYQAFAIPGGFRLLFTVVKITSTATLKTSSATVTTRTLAAEPAMPRISLDVARQCFCQYNYFANRRLVPSGSSLVFGNYEKFYGRVHVNSSTSGFGAPSFYATSSSQYANFYGGFTTTATQRYWSPTNYENSISLSAMFHDNYRFNAESIVMPENAAGQKRAVIGKDPDDTSTFTDQTLGAAYGLNISTSTPNTTQFPNGVYFGNGSKKGSTFAGGIYIRGNVSDLKPTVDPTTKKQVITVTQTPCPTGVTPDNPSTKDVIEGATYCVATGTGVTQSTVTTFTQQANNSWIVTEKVGNNAATTQNVSDSFNGLLFVDGHVGSDDSQALTTVLTPGATGGLGGEGTNDSSVKRNLDPDTGKDLNNSRNYETADIAKDMRLTIAARDNIYIKRNLTYADAPKDDDPATSVDESTYSMLGIFSEQGNILVDGVRSKPIKIDGTIMAVGDKPNEKANTKTLGNGFGTINYNLTLRYILGGQKPTIELTGGVIEEQSQGVGQLSSTFADNTGYDRDFDYDPRFANGKTPPFFPTQGQYTSACFEISMATYGNDGTLMELPNLFRPCTRNSEEVWGTTTG